MPFKPIIERRSVAARSNPSSPSSKVEVNNILAWYQKHSPDQAFLASSRMYRYYPTREKSALSTSTAATTTVTDKGPPVTQGSATKQTLITSATTISRQSASQTTATTNTRPTNTASLAPFSPGPDPVNYPPATSEVDEDDDDLNSRYSSLLVILQNILLTYIFIPLHISLIYINYHIYIIYIYVYMRVYTCIGIWTK